MEPARQRRRTTTGEFSRSVPSAQGASSNSPTFEARRKAIVDKTVTRPAEPRHAILQRKEFQWHLPRGSRIRVHDCAGQDIPTADFGCAAPP